MDFECSTYTDDEGRFDMAGIVPGTYFLSVYDRVEGSGRWTMITAVTVINDDVDLGVVHARKVSPKAVKERIETLRSTESRPRKLLIQLPLLQPGLQWTFSSQTDFLAGKLVVRITHANQVEEFTIFENGILSPNWNLMPFPQPKAGECSTMFEFSRQVITGSDDRIDIELYVAHDLDGIGDLQSGILPAGQYRTQGTYAMLTDEYEVPDSFQALPEEMVDKMREAMSYRAVTGTWETYWPIEITSDQGWLEGEARETVKRLREMTEKLQEQH